RALPARCERRPGSRPATGQRWRRPAVSAWRSGPLGGVCRVRFGFQAWPLHTLIGPRIQCSLSQSCSRYLNAKSFFVQGFSHHLSCTERNVQRIVRTMSSVVLRAAQYWSRSRPRPQGRNFMSISEADMAGNSTLAMPREAAQSAGWRDKAAVFVMLTGGVLNVLALVAIMPAIAAIAAHFAERADASGTVMTLLGYKFGVQLSTQLMITLLNIGIMFAGPLLGVVAGRVGYMRVLPVALII